MLAADEAARAAGVAPGVGAAAARALSPGIALLPREKTREDAALRALACSAGRITPRVSLAADALLLEISACLRLFGGAEKLIEAALAGAAAQGFSAAFALAPTPLGAEWLARRAPGARCLGADDLRQHLDCLPAAALPLRAALALERFGARTLGEARKLPPGALARRIGAESLRLLDRAYGAAPDPRPDFVFPETFALPLPLPAPADNAAALLFAARRLVPALAGWLAARRAGVREIALHLAHRHGETRIGLRFAGPTADEARIGRLLRERLERTALAAPVEALRLEASRIETLPESNRSLLDDAPEGNETIEALLERIAARLGEERVYRIAARADHRPECATRRLPPFGNDAAPAPPPAAPSPLPPRPLWLLDAPEPLPEIEGRPHRHGPLTLVSGPERIESGWWDAGDRRRDYFTALTGSAARLWIYRECPVGGWFLHGFFS